MHTTIGNNLTWFTIRVQIQILVIINLRLCESSMPMPSSQKGSFISFFVRYLANVLREYEGNECRFEIDIFIRILPDRYFEFFFFFCQGRNYFRAIFSSQVSKIYNKASPVKWKHLSVIDREWRNKVVSSISENRVSSCY